MYPFSCGYLCDRDILLVGDIERKIWGQREVCVFFRRLQRHNTTTSFFTTFTLTHTHKHTNTHTHTHDWPTMASRSSGSRGVFLGFARHFWTEVVCKYFFIFGPPGGHATYENIILRKLIVSLVYVSIFTQARPRPRQGLVIFCFVVLFD